MTMIKTVDDLRAQRALAHNDLEVAKSKLKNDTDSWLDETEPLRRVTFLMGDLFKNRYQGFAAKGIQAGITALVGKTVFRRLPTPLNYLVPHMVENAIVNYTHRHGEEWLIKGLRWLKEVTEEDSETEQKYLAAHSSYTTTYYPDPVSPDTDTDPTAMIPS
jgi:hypothetical protein